jgi:CRP-like cAMP-binding protein
MELRNIRSARERLRQYLWLSAEGNGQRVAIEGQLQDVAAELGLSRETFYRTLSALEADGLVERAANSLASGQESPRRMIAIIRTVRVLPLL